ncbi:MAG: hypothetical protein K0R52_1529 [Alphaproteobacteria bacterium]|nr:hypothetical protein [Alphaproteobacteria bacterium]
MVRFLAYAILGAFLGNIAPVLGKQASSGVKSPPKNKPLKNNPSLVKKNLPKKDTRGAAPPKTLKTDDPAVKTLQETSGQKATEKEKAELDAQLKAIPVKMRPLSKKTILIDARRLGEHKFTETIRYIKEHPDMRLKLQNMTIDPSSAVPLLKGFKEAGVIDQIRDIGFVMLPGPLANQVLNEDAFIKDILPYLGHLEAIDLSCLGVSDKVVRALPKETPYLKHLSLFGVGITDGTVEILANQFPDLVKIHLINTSLTKEGIKGLATKFPYLRAIGISGQNLKDDDFDALKEAAPNLHSLAMIGQVFKNMGTIKNLLENMPNLHTLDLSETNVTDEVAKNIPVTVKSLDISETAITDKGVKEIVTRLDLTTLKMNNLKRIGKPEIIFIADKQPGLKKFYFSGAYFDDPAVMNLILKLPELVDITLIPNPEAGWSLSDSVAEALHLKKVKLQYLRIPARRLPEVLRLKLQKEISNLRIEYEGN